VNALNKIRTVAEFTRIEHTLFALPFAFMGAVLAAGSIPDLTLLLWVFVGLVGGRSASLMINDIIDKPIDSANPRTGNRPLPSGGLSNAEAYALVAAASLVLFYSAYRINTTAFVLSPIILVHAYVYPHTKRYTTAAHFVLGLNGSYAPIGGWIAVRGTDTATVLGGLSEVAAYLGSFEYYPSLLLGGALVFWYAGFDIIYAFQDVEFDREYGLRSVPAVYGRETARRVSAACHGIMVVFLFALVGWTASAGFEAAVFGAGVVLAAGLLVYEHLIAEHDLGKAFFTVNAVVSAALFFSLVAAVLL
jgi:4-hydroxybenzoate polyprenyltransferase